MEWKENKKESFWDSEIENLRKMEEDTVVEEVGCCKRKRTWRKAGSRAIFLVSNFRINFNLPFKIYTCLSIEYIKIKSSLNDR